jgi:hypothetical protein
MYPPPPNNCGTNLSDILMYTLRMTLFLDQRVHGYRVWMDFGNDVPGKSTSLSPNASGISSPKKQPLESDHPIAREVVLLSTTANLSLTMNPKNLLAHQTFQQKNSIWKWLLYVRGNSSRRLPPVTSSWVDLCVDEYEEFADKDIDVYCPSTCCRTSHCLCRRSILKNESLRSTRI